MSLWSQIQYLSNEAKQQVYNKYQQLSLPIDVRQHLAVWIENNIIVNDVPGNERPDVHISMICSELIKEINRVSRIVGNNNDFSSIRLTSAAQYFLTLSPADLYARFQACLAEEMRLLNEQTNMQNMALAGESIDCDADSKRASAVQAAVLSQKVCKLVNERNKWTSYIDNMQLLLKNQQILREQRETAQNRAEYFGNQNLNGNGSTINFENNFQKKLLKIDEDIHANVTKIRENAENVMLLARVLITELNEIVPILLSDYVQKLKWSEAVPEYTACWNDIPSLLKWYDDLLETISTLRHIWISPEYRNITQICLQYTTPSAVQHLLDQLNYQFSVLISNSLIVEDQPSQVIKKETKFNTKCRFLCGEKYISTPQGFPIVQVSVINEKQASLLHQNNAPNQVTYQGCGKIINSTGSRCSDSGTSMNSSHGVVIQFSNVAISSVRRGETGEKRSANRAMTEKFCLFFTSNFEINGQNYEVWCCSVPFVFIVHVSQKPEGWATIFWENAFRESNRVPFSIPDEVPWSKLAIALRKCFRSMTNTSWNLTDSNLQYIGNKLFNTKGPIPENLYMSRKSFFEKENSTKMGSWEWIYGIIELINKHLQPFWKTGVIVGFVDRQKAEMEILPRYKPGTFMLRFSDSTLGGISISFVVLGPDGKKEIQSLSPFTDADLKIRTLADRIHDAEQFENVYYHNKDGQEFFAHKSQAFPHKNDLNNLFGAAGAGAVRRSYVKAGVVMVIASTGNSSQSSSISEPGTPGTPGQYNDNSFTQMQGRRESGGSLVPSPMNAPDPIDYLLETETEMNDEDMDPELSEYIISMSKPDPTRIYEFLNELEGLDFLDDQSPEISSTIL